MAYSHDYYHDDPVELESPNGKQKKSSFFALIALLVSGGFFLQTTLASNISLGSASPVEFGQGTLQATACSGLTNLEMTPTASFTNAAGSGGFKFSSVTVSNIPAGCEGSDFTINAYENSSNTPLALFNSASTSAVIYDNAGTFEPGAGITGMTVASSPGTFTATFAAPVAFSSSISKITLQSGAHAPPVVYTVGQTGPGGGIVYYVSASPFTSAGSTCNTTCKYLEVAPATWQSAGVSIANDSAYQGSTNTVLTTGQDITTPSTEGIVAMSAFEKFNWKIGQGFYNTSVMKVSGATSTAKAAVLAYAGTSVAGQWFIPSMNELNELCKYAGGQATGVLTAACDHRGTLKTGTANDLGGFVDDYYWSSSEENASNAWNQYFDGGNRMNFDKTTTLYVRPVRAF